MRAGPVMMTAYTKEAQNGKGRPSRAALCSVLGAVRRARFHPSEVCTPT